MRTTKLSHKFNLKTVFVICIVLLSASALQIKAQDIEIEKLVEQVSGISQSETISDYSYLMKFSFKRHKVGGRRFTRLYEAIIPTISSTNHVFRHSLILLEDSEKIVSSKEVKFLREKASKELEEIESKKAADQADAVKSRQSDSYWTMGFSENTQYVKVDILELLKNSRLSNLQRKQIDGTNVVLIDFTPKTESKLEKPLSYLSRIEGQIRIDETSRRIVRVEGFPIGTFGLQKDKVDGDREREASLFFVQLKVAENIWLPKTVKINLATLPKFYDPVEIEMSFTQYRKGAITTQYQNQPADTDGDSESKKP